MPRRTNDDIFGALIEINSAISRLDEKLTNTSTAFTKHVDDDRQLGADLRSLQLAYAKQSGAARVWGLVGGAIGSAVLTVAGYFWGRH